MEKSNWRKLHYALIRAYAGALTQKSTCSIKVKEKKILFILVHELPLIMLSGLFCSCSGACLCMWEKTSSISSVTFPTSPPIPYSLFTCSRKTTFYPRLWMPSHHGPLMLSFLTWRCLHLWALCAGQGSSLEATLTQSSCMKQESGPLD